MFVRIFSYTLHEVYLFVRPSKLRTYSCLYCTGHKKFLSKSTVLNNRSMSLCGLSATTSLHCPVTIVTMVVILAFVLLISLSLMSMYWITDSYQVCLGSLTLYTSPTQECLSFIGYDLMFQMQHGGIAMQVFFTSCIMYLLYCSM